MPNQLRNLIFRNNEQWANLLRISLPFRLILNRLLRLMNQKRYDFVIRFPFSDFFFRPFVPADVFMAFGLWEPYIRDTVRIGQAGLFIDVGAYIGYHSLLASKSIGQNGLVIAIEPDSRNIAILKKNIASSTIKNIIMIEKAIGRIDKVKFSLADDPLYARIHDSSCKEEYYVEAIKLDSLLDQISQIESHSKKKFQPVFLKIDVEGSEIDVIYSAYNLIHELLPTIIVEISSEEKINEISKFLEDMKYESFTLFGSYRMYKPVK